MRGDNISGSNEGKEEEEEGNLRMGVLDFDSAGFVGFRPLHEGIVNERLEDAHEGLSVGPEHGEADLADLQEDTLVARDAQAVDHVLRIRMSSCQSTISPPFFQMRGF